MNSSTDQVTDEKAAASPWFKRVLAGSFLFFLIKGLVWVAVFVAAYLGWQEA